jgi:glycosyl transferase family 87
MDLAVSRFRPLAWPLAIVVLASIVYAVRIQKEMVDFAVYRTAATRALSGEPLYRESDGHYQYKYLPAFAFAVAPFAHLEPEAAKAIWFALSVGLLSAFLRWSVRGLPERRRSERALIWLSILFMGKFYAHELNLGQSNILLGTVLMGALLSTQVDQPALAGALVGIGIFVKPYAVVLLPWLAVAAGLSGLVVALGVLTAGLLLPAAVYGWTGNLEQIAAWYRTVTETSAPNLLVAENISLATMWAKWIGPGVLATRLAVATALGALVVAAATIAKRRHFSEPNYLEFGLLMLLVPLLSPQGWDYVLLLATPAIICLLDRLGDMSLGWRTGTLTAMIVMSFTIFDLLGRTLYARMMAISIVSVCALALVGSLAYVRWKAFA